MLCGRLGGIGRLLDHQCAVGIKLLLTQPFEVRVQAIGDTDSGLLAEVLGGHQTIVGHVGQKAHLHNGGGDKAPVRAGHIIHFPHFQLLDARLLAEFIEDEAGELMALGIVRRTGGIRVGGRLADGQGAVHAVVRPAVGMDADVGGGVMLVGDLSPIHIADMYVVRLADHHNAVATADKLIPQKQRNTEIQLVLGLLGIDADSAPRDLGLHNLRIGAVGLEAVASLHLVKCYLLSLA